MWFLLERIFGDKNKFEIFRNNKYNNEYSVKHLGGYIYINPHQFGGAGISYDKSECGSHKTINQSIDFVEEWARICYDKKFSDLKIIIK